MGMGTINTPPNRIVVSRGRAVSIEEWGWDKSNKTPINTFKIERNWDETFTWSINGGSSRVCPSIDTLYEACDVAGDHIKEIFRYSGLNEEALPSVFDPFFVEFI